jgi:hypothetical protein
VGASLLFYFRTFETITRSHAVALFVAKVLTLVKLESENVRFKEDLGRVLKKTHEFACDGL